MKNFWQYWQNGYPQEGETVLVTSGKETVVAKWDGTNFIYDDLPISGVQWWARIPEVPAIPETVQEAARRGFQGR